jgi:ABC-type lipoprotein release transport system permease subunit
MDRSGFVASVALTSSAILRRSRLTTIVLDALDVLVLANLVAALPGRSAARTHPAQALRSE